jgi:hypothetical protein
MGTFTGPDIPTNGLVLALDATSERSYPGSGTTWYDLSGLGNDATLINGTSWNSSGYFETDGVDQTITIPNDSSLQVTTGFTQVIWVKLNNITAVGFAQLFGKPGYTKYGMIVEWTGGNPIVFDFANTAGRNVVSLTAGSGSWIMVAQSYNAAGGSNNRICNIRGGVTATNTQTKTGNVLTDSSGMAIGGPRSEADIGLALLYNRGLTQVELDQIYNAQKNRFI